MKRYKVQRADDEWVVWDAWMEDVVEHAGTHEQARQRAEALESNENAEVERSEEAAKLGRDLEEAFRRISGRPPTPNYKIDVGKVLDKAFPNRRREGARALAEWRRKWFRNSALPIRAVNPRPPRRSEREQHEFRRRVLWAVQRTVVQARDTIEKEIPSVLYEIAQEEGLDLGLPSEKPAFLFPDEGTRTMLLGGMDTSQEALDRMLAVQELHDALNEFHSEAQAADVVLSLLMVLQQVEHLDINRLWDIRALARQKQKKALHYINWAIDALEQPHRKAISTIQSGAAPQSEKENLGGLYWETVVLRGAYHRELDALKELHSELSQDQTCDERLSNLFGMQTDRTSPKGPGDSRKIAERYVSRMMKDALPEDFSTPWKLIAALMTAFGLPVTATSLQSRQT